MIVQVTAEVRVRFDGTCFVIEKRAVTKQGPKTKEGNEGKERWEGLGYYGWMSQAFAALLQRRGEVWLGHDEVVDVKRLIQEIGAAEAHLLQAIQEVRVLAEAKELPPGAAGGLVPLSDDGPTTES